MADIKFSDFPKATESKNTDEIAILQDGVNKMIESPILESKMITRTVEELSKKGGVSLNLVNLKGVVSTYADLPSVGLLVNDAYQVNSDGLVYVWNGNSFQPNGQGFKVQPEVNGVVESGNNSAVTGGKVYNSIYNIGLEYPLINAPTNLPEPILSEYIKSTKVIIDAELRVREDQNTLYTFAIVGIWYHRNLSGDIVNAVMLKRKHKTTGVDGFVVIQDRNNEANTTDLFLRNELKKFDNKTSFQELFLYVKSWGIELDLLVNTKELDTENMYLNFGYGGTTVPYFPNYRFIDYVTFVLTKNNSRFLLVDAKYNTVRDAIIAKHLGEFSVKDFKFRSVVSSIVSEKNGVYMPSLISQYKLLNNPKNLNGLKRSGSIIKVYDQENNACTIKYFSREYIYFASGKYLYRTQQGFNFANVTKDNTKYERIVLDENLPDSSSVTSNRFQNVFELDNGELLIEIRNGIKDDPEQDYRGQRVQVYLTSGFKNFTRTEVNGITEITVPNNNISRVCQYLSNTGTQGKTGTTVSIKNNVIVLSPYGLGVSGLVFLSTDFGQTFNVIFNMGVMLPEFKAKHATNVGAYPLPSQLNPQMPSDMWTLGGNSNSHVHGCYYDEYQQRIYVCTGDSGTNEFGRTALWYTDNLGVNWVRMQVKGANVLDSPQGLQPMGLIGNKNYLLVSSDSQTDGLYRLYRDDNKAVVPTIESAYFCNDEKINALRFIGGGGVYLDENQLYYVMHPNVPTYNGKGIVVYTNNGFDFTQVYEDEFNLEINWGSYPFKDKYGQLYINGLNSIIKLT